MKYLLLFLISTTLYATVKDCSVVTSNLKECNPYTKNLISKVETIKEPLKTKVISIDYKHMPQKKEIVGKIEPLKTYGVYRVARGDTLSTVAFKFRTKLKYIANLNSMKNIALLKVDQKIKLPLTQFMIDTISTARYKIVSGDTLYAIAKKFGLNVKEIIAINKIKDPRRIRIGQKILLPFPHIKKIRVTATAYTSHVNQTDDTPFIAAWNNKLKPGMKIIAVSRDLLTKYGLSNGTKVRISGLKDIYVVRDKMNKRYKKRIDIYMGLDIKKAIQWGKRSVIISW